MKSSPYTSIVSFSFSLHDRIQKKKIQVTDLEETSILWRKDCDKIEVQFQLNLNHTTIASIFLLHSNEVKGIRWVVKILVYLCYPPPVISNHQSCDSGLSTWVVSVCRDASVIVACKKKEIDCTVYAHTHFFSIHKHPKEKVFA